MKYFKESEWVKDPAKVNPKLKNIIDELRGSLGVPAIIHVAWSDSGHSANSYHYKGLAVDIHFKNSELGVQLAHILSFPEINGIGFYPWWNNPGWHLDLRQKRTYWYSPKYNKYVYGKNSLFKGILNKKRR